MLLIVVAITILPGLYGVIKIRARLDCGESAILVLGGSDGSRERHAFALASAFDRLMQQQPQDRGRLHTSQKSSTRKSSDNNAPPNTDPVSQARHLTQRKPIRIWISTGRPRPEITRISNHTSIGSARIELDYRAVDTITNFTTMAPKMSAANISTVYVVTDVTHIDRAMIIANVVLGYYGIKPVAAPSPNTTKREREWIIRGWRDYLRSVIWFYTGKSGAHLMALRSLSVWLGYKIQRHLPFD
jgi:hypothetical protein